MEDKTMLLYSIKSLSHIETFSIDLSYAPFKLYQRSKKDVYIYNYHHSNIHSILKPNPQSDEVFDTKVDDLFFLNLCENFTYVDKDDLQSIFNDLTLHHGVNPDNLENDYKILRNELTKILTEKDTKSLTHVSQKISIYQNLIRIKRLLGMDLHDKKIYLPFKVDFRGRTYFLSDISPTNFKEFRFCLHYGEYNSLELEDHVFNQIITPELNKYISVIEN
jgi:hypothetical protein